MFSPMRRGAKLPIDGSRPGPRCLDCDRADRLRPWRRRRWRWRHGGGGGGHGGGGHSGGGHHGGGGYHGGGGNHGGYYHNGTDITADFYPGYLLRLGLLRLSGLRVRIWL